jgi:plastin-1
MEALRLQKKYPEVSRDEMFELINRFKYVSPSIIANLALICIRSAISTDTPGRIDKPSVLQSLQSGGESYDRARETLKHVSVDASGKLELEDWVEVILLSLP